MNETAQTDMTPVKLLLAWAIAVVPLAWGVYHTVLAASKLFG